MTDQAISLLDQARTAFKNGDYTGALDLTNQALRQLPNDPALHEFRALVAVRAAAVRRGIGIPLRRAVRGAGVGLDDHDQTLPRCGYLHQTAPGPGVLRGSEPAVGVGAVRAAYLYLTQGHTESAIAELKVVRQLQPEDTLTAQLLQQLDTTQEPTSTTPAAASFGARRKPRTDRSGQLGLNATAGRRAGRLTGTWTAGRWWRGHDHRYRLPDAEAVRLARSPGRGKRRRSRASESDGDGISTLRAETTRRPRRPRAWSAA